MSIAISNDLDSYVCADQQMGDIESCLRTTSGFLGKGLEMYLGKQENIHGENHRM